MSERLDIVPAEFFVHRHIYGKWACRCCQRQGIERLAQESADPQIIDGGIPASGLVAHTLISGFVDHLPYYRQEAINGQERVQEIGPREHRELTGVERVEERAVRSRPVCDCGRRGAAGPRCHPKPLRDLGP